MIRLTLELESSLVEVLDRIVHDDGEHQTDDLGRRQAVVKLLLDRGKQLRKGAGKSGRGELAAVRRERDSLRKALENERATYRSMALRVEAALRRAPPREDLGSLEGRLRRALRAAGFDMPAAPNRKPSRNSIE